MPVKLKSIRRLTFGILFFLFSFLFLTHANAQRVMENLGRGLVAFRTSETEVFLSWRMLGTDPADVSFNLYRNTTLVASTASTNFVDQVGMNENYCVKAVINGVEQEGSSCVGVTIQPYIGIPLQPLEGYGVHFVWVGDLDGDGEYDFIVDRHGAGSSKLEAYRRDGSFLWRYDCGPNGLNKDNIAPGSSAISVGHADDVTVYDLDSDGQAEVIVKTANGVIFGDGTTLTHDNDNEQFISVLNGLTGAEEVRAPVPDDYINVGPVQGHFGIMYCDGVNPSFIFKAKNRRSDGGFNEMVVAYDYKDDQLTQRWKWNHTHEITASAHQIRILDIDGDGRDELCDGGHVIDDDGTFLYHIPGVVHGDRFHITDFDPDRPGLEGYYIQQNNPSGLAWVYYDAKDGSVIKQQVLDAPHDLARGTAADLDPRYKGVEFWTFTDGIYTPQSETPISTNFPWPNFKIWWDGDLLGELLNGERISKWIPEAEIESRLLTASDYGAVDSWRDAAQFHGDILGDWREEVIFANNNQSEIMIFSTTHPTTERLYTLPHNPAYRACMTVKGYQQSNLVDYYLGNEMEAPPAPDIAPVPGTPTDDDSPLWRPQHLIATVHGDTVSLTWGVNPDARVTGYNLCRSETSGGPYEKLNDSPIHGNSFMDTLLVLETAYYYTLASVDAEANESALSAEVSATPTLRSAPPTGLSATAKPDTVFLTWQRHEDAHVVGYNVYRSEISGQSYEKVNEEWLADTSYFDLDIVNETTYFYVLTAVNDFELESIYSAEVNATPGYSIFLQAEDAEIGGGGSHDTNHNSFFGTGFVNLPASGGFVEFQNIDGNEGDTIILKYRYALGNNPRTGKLQVNDKQRELTMESTGDWSAWRTDEIVVVLNAGTDNVIRFETTGQDFGNLDQIVIAPAPPGTMPDPSLYPKPLNVFMSNHPAFHIYPNPAENKIVVESRYPARKVQVMGLTGATVYSRQVEGNRIEIDLKNIDKGLYIIRLITDEGHFNEKVIIR